MTALSAFFIRQASGRNVLISLALLAICILIFNLFLTPLYQEVSSGFIPLDLQFPLSREMIVIQLGAMTPLSSRAYGYFAALDMIFPPLSAAAFILLWAWLAEKSGSAALVAAYRRGWWIWAIFPCLCDWAENVAFVSIIFGHPVINPDMIEAAIVAHRGKAVFFAIAQVISAALVVVAAALWLKKQH